jgi:hypothetical protein
VARTQPKLLVVVIARARRYQTLVGHRGFLVVVAVVIIVIAMVIAIANARWRLAQVSHRGFLPVGDK